MTTIGLKLFEEKNKIKLTVPLLVHSELIDINGKLGKSLADKDFLAR